MSYNSKRTGAEVETLLNKAETALQSVPSEYVTEGVLNEGLKGKADVDGVYPEMTVGMTRDMLGVGEGDEGEFLFRPTDGDGSIKDGFASIERIEGNSVVWNADTLSSTNFSDQYIDVLEDAEGRFVGTYKGGAANNASFYLFAQKAKVIGHEYILSYDVETTCEYDIILAGGYSRFAEDFWVTIPPKKKTRIDAVISMVAGEAFVSPTGLYFYYNYSGSLQANDKIILSNLRIHDLTQMFGAGNEPSTVEEFYQRIPNVDLNAYNEGEIVDCKVQGIKSVGFNAWDEQWDNGRFDITTGENINDDASIVRAKNKINILPNTEYYAYLPTGASAWVILFDENDNVIEGYAPQGRPSAGNSFVIGNGSKFKTSPLSAKMMFYMVGYSSTYNHDICIHLVHTGYRNGEYEPYVSDEIALPIADYFPNGMRSIGDVKDELTATEAIQRIGAVDLGTLPWFRETGKDGAIIMLSNGLANLAVRPIWSDEKANIICAKYQTYSAYEVVQNAIGASFNPSGDILIYDPAYTDTASFANAMSGVMLYYELAEPIVTTFDEPLDLDYQVWDFGTEEAIAEGKTTPLKASIIYEFNARDTIRNNRNMVEELLRRTTVLSQEIEKKQDIISDLSTIRSGANKGDTSEQTANKTTTLSSSSTDSQYPSAKAVYDALQNIGGGSANRPIVKHGNADTIFTLTPNTVHQWEQVAELSLTLPQDDSHELEFFVLVEPNTSDFILTMSSNMQWANGDIPAFEAGKQYEINIRGSRASYNMYYAPAPSGTYISYVANNGSDYILTDIIIDNNIVGFEAKVVPLFDKPSESSTYYALMGTRKSSSTTDTSIGIYYMSSGVIPYWSGAKKSSVGSIVNGEMLTIDIDYGAIAVNNTNPLAIFGLNTAGSVERIGKFRIYSLAFNNAAGEKVVELKPFKRMDGAYGLRDTISGKFYTSVKNQLTGA